MKKQGSMNIRIAFFILMNSFSLYLYAQNDFETIKKKIHAFETSVDSDCKRHGLFQSYTQMLHRIELDNKTKVIVFAKDSIVRKLSILVDDEGNGDPFIHYYFDSSGKLVSSLYHGLDSSTNHVIFLYKRVLTSIIDKLNNINTDDRNNQNSKSALAEAKFILDFYLSNFTNLRYSTFDITDNETFTLVTYKTVFLRGKPSVNSPIVKKLPPGIELTYLDRSDHQDIFNGKEKWIWYKVRLSQNVIGWVWGHPSLIGENIQY